MPYKLYVLIKYTASLLLSYTFYLLNSGYIYFKVHETLIIMLFKNFIFSLSHGNVLIPYRSTHNITLSSFHDNSTTQTPVRVTEDREELRYYQRPSSKTHPSPEAPKLTQILPTMIPKPINWSRQLLVPPLYYLLVLHPQWLCTLLPVHSATIP